MVQQRRRGFCLCRSGSKIDPLRGCLGCSGMYSSDEFDFVDLIEAGAGECVEQARDSSVSISASLTAIPTTRTPPKKTALSEEGELAPLEDFYSLANAASDDEDAQYFPGNVQRTGTSRTSTSACGQCQQSSNKSGKGRKRWFPSKRHQ